MYPTWVVRTPTTAAARAAWAPPLASRTALVDRAQLARVLAAVVDPRGRRPGLGQRWWESASGPVVDALIKELGPRLSALVADISQAAEPTIRTVVREELAPKVGLYAGMALLTAGVLSGIVGAYFASRGRIVASRAA